MAIFLGNLRLIRWATLLTLQIAFFAVLIHSQSDRENLSSDGRPPSLIESNQKSKQPVPNVARTEPSSAVSPQETRQAQIEADTKKLYQLAAELRVEVAKTYKETLSLNVIKKAEEVEKLARSLKIEISKEAAATKH